ncbi:hypothetical protein CYMTET_9763 [Cymbomonas tetramitiformis]|uniref:IBR domain-containing protein n=1 Tax=Cymbomonas tetramitiformis TaxID=36881 RepID=A0AAE0F6R9_9CHLO|nr:hypothetical protein CYMTET_37416 [Cymbomonas tetramitiformis]KAK3282488.1 hypothetical protein CYMTET_9763 [Cymbomonas tetramitiformis]
MFEVWCTHCDPPLAPPPQRPPPPPPRPAGENDDDRGDDEVIEIDIDAREDAAGNDDADVIRNLHRCYTAESVKRAFSDSDKTSAHGQRVAYLEAVIAAKLRVRTEINDAEISEAVRNYQQTSRLQRLYREAEELCSLRCPGHTSEGRPCEYIVEGFDGCMAVQCNAATGCNTHFCAYCFATFENTRECHDHVSRCPESINRGEYFCTDVDGLRELYDEKKRTRVESMLANRRVKEDDKARVMEHVNTMLR